MKTIGLIGGMSWESTDIYYQQINRKIREQQKKWHSAKVILHSVDFQEILDLQEVGNWQQIGHVLSDHAHKLQSAGADAVVLCTNTMHKLAPIIQENLNIPFLHIVDALADGLKAQKINKVGVLGTAFTMQEPFYQERLAEHQIDMIVPDLDDQKIVHDIIYAELCQGVITEASKEAYKKVIKKLIDSGAQGIVLGCTEIMLLVGKENFTVPLFDTTTLHIHKAVDFALSK